MSDENKKRTAVWLSPGVIRRMDSWLEEDNCSTRSEFIEKALRFYMGYLATEDTSEYLSQALVDTLQGIVADNSNRLRTMIFKWCVELNMMGHTIAAHFRADPINRRELRAYAVDEVKRTNGQLSFDRALDQQRRLLDDGHQIGQPNPVCGDPPRCGGAPGGARRPACHKKAAGIHPQAPSGFPRNTGTIGV